MMLNKMSHYFTPQISPVSNSLNWPLSVQSCWANSYLSSVVDKRTRKRRLCHPVYLCWTNCAPQGGATLFVSYIRSLDVKQDAVPVYRKYLIYCIVCSSEQPLCNNANCKKCHAMYTWLDRHMFYWTALNRTIYWTIFCRSTKMFTKETVCHFREQCKEVKIVCLKISWVLRSHV